MNESLRVKIFKYYDLQKFKLSACKARSLFSTVYHYGSVLTMCQGQNLVLKHK